jgi:2-dehydro-3-deoxyphosphooctonate aldolase (KDO 8-P synthase)
VIESPEHAMMMARECLQRAQAAGLDFVFKSSFDKANRSSIHSFRGLGMEAGLEVLRDVKKEFGIPVLTDIHDVSQVERVAEVVDVLQIPAFLCRQTDLIVAATKSGRAVNVKKGQFLAPQDARNIVDKVREAGGEKLLLTERGASFGYNNLVVDMRSLPIMRAGGTPVVFDVTHSLQIPGGGDGVTGGRAEFIEPLASAGVAAGVDGVFLEVHEDPARARSDAQNALRLALLEPLIRKLMAIDAIAKQSEVRLRG